MNIINPHIFAPPGPDTSFKMEFTTTASNTTVYLPIGSNDTSGKLVFDDGTSDVIGNADEATHTFTSAGVYVIKYYGTAFALEWGSSASTAQKQFLTKILDWGITGATRALFRYCSSLISVAANLESTTTETRFCFGYSTGNPDVSLLDTSNVTSMESLFRSTTSANPDVSSWDVSSVTNMQAMFTDATSANPDVSSWDTGSLTNAAIMFYGATSANPDVSSWDTSSVTNIDSMFAGATSANPDMSSWNFSSVTTYKGSRNPGLLANSNISTTNYDGFLNKLNADRITYSLTGRAIGDIPSTYTTSVSGAARTALLANGWTFTDDGGV